MSGLLGAPMGRARVSTICPTSTRARRLPPFPRLALVLALEPDPLDADNEPTKGGPMFRRIAPAVLALPLVLACAGPNKLAQRSEEKLAGGDSWRAWQLATRALDREPGN